MAYRGSNTSGTSAGFSLPAVTSRGGTSGSSAVGGTAASGQGSSSSASTLLSGFNNAAAGSDASRAGVAPGSGAGSLGGLAAGGAFASSTTSTASGGASGLPNTAQAAFMNAGPNRTVSNVGQQAAQTGPAQGAYGSREFEVLLPGMARASVSEVEADLDCLDTVHIIYNTMQHYSLPLTRSSLVICPNSQRDESKFRGRPQSGSIRLSSPRGRQFSRQCVIKCSNELFAVIVCNASELWRLRVASPTRSRILLSRTSLSSSTARIQCRRLPSAGWWSDTTATAFTSARCILASTAAAVATAQWISNKWTANAVAVKPGTSIGSGGAGTQAELAGDNVSGSPESSERRVKCSCKYIAA